MGFGNLPSRKEDPELRSYLEAMVMLSMSGGDIEDSEVDAMVLSTIKLPRMNGLTDRQLNQMFGSSIKDIQREGLDGRIRALAQKLPSTDQRLEAIGMALSVSMSNGNIEPQKKDILKKMQRAFGLSDQQIGTVIQRYR